MFQCLLVPLPCIKLKSGSLLDTQWIHKTKVNKKNSVETKRATWEFKRQTEKSSDIDIGFIMKKSFKTQEKRLSRLNGVYQSKQFPFMKDSIENACNPKSTNYLNLFECRAYLPTLWSMQSHTVKFNYTLSSFAVTTGSLNRVRLCRNLSEHNFL